MHKAIWITNAEVRVQPGDMPSGDTLGFMKITMWAASRQDFEERVSAYFKKYQWDLLSADHSFQVDPDADYGDEVNQMIDETAENENFVRLGTYYSYKPE
jgi:hypothetical protein